MTLQSDINVRKTDFNDEFGVSICLTLQSDFNVPIIDFNDEFGASV